MVAMVNDLLQRGTLKLSKDRRYLTYADGTPFFYLADTWWFGATGRMSWHDFKVLVAVRKRQGFTAVQIVVGYPPEIDPHSPDASNHGGWALSPDMSINHSYFAEVDKKIKYLVKQGIVPVIVGSWGYHIDLLGENAMTLLWKEIVTSYGKFPVIWCLCGEVDLMSPPSSVEPGKSTLSSIYSLIKKCLALFPPLVRLVRRIRHQGDSGVNSRLAKWSGVARSIKSHSSNLLMVHIFSRQSASELFHAPSWLDINTIQSGHTREGMEFMIRMARSSQKVNLPFINLEPWYEGILGDFGPADQRHAFWACILSGAKGHSYGANGIWQMSSTNDPFLTHWGISNWREAIKYAGAKQLGLAKKWLMKIPWWELVPAQQRLITSASLATLNQPILSEIKDSHLLIYLPLKRPRQSYKVGNFKRHKTYNVRYISPATMRTVSQENFTNQVSYTIRELSQQDSLVVISQKLPRM